MNTTPEMDIQTENIDDIPLLFALLDKMGLQAIIDETIEPHGNRQGLSIGWSVIIWLLHILTEHNHCLDAVCEWVPSLQHTLGELTGQPINKLDFTDDRLADILRALSVDEDWQTIEQKLTRHCLRVYHLPANRVRLDATTATVNHSPEAHDLFKVGRSKSGDFATQFKVMLGSLDSLGMPLSIAVVPGNYVDDPLYIPVYQKIKATLQTGGVLYVGDCKMGSLENRATFVVGQDLYLLPLPKTGEIPALLTAWLEPVWEGIQELTPIYLPDDGETPLEERQIATGLVVTRPQSTIIAGEEVEWQERCPLIHSPTYAKTQNTALQNRLDKAETALNKLTPPIGRGQRQITTKVALESKIQAITKKYKVTGLFEFEIERQVSERSIRAYQDQPARTETKVRYQLTTRRDPVAIAEVTREFGWRVYATNATPEQLTLNEAVLVYRKQYLVENIFKRLKGSRLSLTPLYLKRDDHALGLVRLLTLAVRLMALAEYTVRQALAETNTELSGVYAGNPKRSTPRPTTERILRAFRYINLTVVHLPAQIIYHVTPLTLVQQRILELLGLDTTLYTDLATTGS